MEVAKNEARLCCRLRTVQLHAVRPAVFFSIFRETTRRFSIKVGIMSGLIELSSVVARHEAVMTEVVQPQGYGPDWILAGQEIFLFSKTSRPTLASLRLLAIWDQWVPPWEESGRSVKLTTCRLVLRLKIYIAIPALHMMPF